MLGPGEVPSDPVDGDQVAPTIGITDTPVIDPTTNTIYLVAMSKTVVGGPRPPTSSGSTPSTSPPGPTGSPPSRSTSRSPFPGTGPGGNGTERDLRPQAVQGARRPDLSNGVVYTGWASHSDDAPYTGWVIGFRASDLGLASVLNINPNGSPNSSFLDDGSGSSFWNSGGGSAADAAGQPLQPLGQRAVRPDLNAAGFPPTATTATPSSSSPPPPAAWPSPTTSPRTTSRSTPTPTTRHRLQRPDPRRRRRRLGPDASSS